MREERFNVPETETNRWAIKPPRVLPFVLLPRWMQKGIFGIDRLELSPAFHPEKNDRKMIHRKQKKSEREERNFFEEFWDVSEGKKEIL